MLKRTARVLIVIGALMAAVITPGASAKPAATASLREFSPCNVTATYSWSGVGKPHVAAEFTISNVFGPVRTLNVNATDRSGTIVDSFTGDFLTTYSIEGYLIDKNGHHFLVRTDQLTTVDCRV